MQNNKPNDTNELGRASALAENQRGDLGREETEAFFAECFPWLFTEDPDQAAAFAAEGQPGTSYQRVSSTLRRHEHQQETHAHGMATVADRNSAPARPHGGSNPANTIGRPSVILENPEAYSADIINHLVAYNSCPLNVGPMFNAQIQPTALPTAAAVPSAAAAPATGATSSTPFGPRLRSSSWPTAPDVPTSVAQVTWRMDQSATLEENMPFGSGTPLGELRETGPTVPRMTSAPLPSLSPQDWSQQRHGDTAISQAMQPQQRRSSAGAARQTGSRGRGASGSADPKRRASFGGIGSRGSGGGAGRVIGAPRAMKKSGCTGWDTARRKYTEIATLEAEMQEKLSLVGKLEAQNQELARKERLLQLQVSTDEKTLLCTNAMFPSQLTSLLQSFRSSVNQMHAGQLIAQMPKDPKDMTRNEFLMMWRSFTAEVADVINVEKAVGQTPQLLQRAEELCERVANFTMSICVHKFMLMPEVQSLNMLTGEELIQPMEFWEQVVDKLGLMDEQLRDLNATYELQGTLLQEQTTQMADLLQQLSGLVHVDVHGQEHQIGGNKWHEAMTQKEALIKSLQGTFRHYQMLATTMAFLVLYLMSPMQRCHLLLNSLPSYPNVRLILAAARKKHLRASAMAMG